MKWIYVEIDGQFQLMAITDHAAETLGPDPENLYRGSSIASSLREKHLQTQAVNQERSAIVGRSGKRSANRRRPSQ